jgi:hypothetical protein
VASDNSLFVGQDWIGEAELKDAGRELSNLLGAVRSGVVLVRRKPILLGYIL